jgi:hypothetical protein
MTKLFFFKVRLITTLTFLVFGIAGCGSKMEGTYSQGGGPGTIALDLKSGGKATFTMMGEDYACTYKVNGDKLALDCSPKGEKLNFTIHDDGSLTGPGFIGVLKKSK